MRYYFLTLGCPKNEVDSEGMGQRLAAAGHTPAPDAAQADVLIVNTCGFIDPARQESLAALRQLAAAKRPGQRLIAAGCLAELAGDALLAAVPGVDATLGTRRSHDIVSVAEDHSPCPPIPASPCPPIPASPRPPVPPSPPPRVSTSPSAYLQIAEGCNGPCAFCLIPRIKGPYRSKPAPAIVQEARELAEQGVQEIILIAQDTTAYGRDLGEEDGLARLLESLVAQVPQVAWWRILYAYPQHVTPRLIQTMAAHPSICHYLDIPLQHAHPATLRRMNRPADVARVRWLIESLRAAMPDIALRTTFIVGYPGETRREFRALLDFVREARFDHVGAFTFWPQEGTPAAALPDPTPRRVQEERLRRLMEAQQVISLANNQAQVGRELRVLVEGPAEVEGDSTPWLVGRCYRDAPEIDGLVWVRGPAPPGPWVTACITHATEYDLWAEGDPL